MENNLPESWVTTTLNNICSIETGKWDANHAVIGGEYRFYTCAFEYQFSNTKRFSGDCIILPGNGANVGEVFFYSGEFDAYQRTYILSNFLIDTKYAFYHLKYQWREINKEKQYGSATNFIKMGNFLDYEIPLAPLPEQHRIVAKLDELMEKTERIKKRLEKIPLILKRFRQSVLAAAVSGDLYKTKSDWQECELSSLVPKGGIFDGPFGSNLKTSDYTDKGVRVIRLENIEHLNFINEKETFVSFEKYQTLKRHTVEEGDIIFSSFIMEEIRVCKLPKLKTKAIAKADCFCIRPDEKKVSKDFLLLILASGNSYNQLVENIHGATRPRINTTQLKKLIVSIPPPKEQHEIVRRVEALFAFADKIETRYTKAKAQFDKLPQALLAKAFKGELVEQDAGDESASVLLERIKKEKQSKSIKKEKALA